MTGFGVRGLVSPHTFLGATRCAVRIVLWFGRPCDVCSTSSCSTTRRWRCLSFRSSTECSNFQLFYRGVYAQCKLCISRRFYQRSSLTLFTCPLLCVDRCRRWSRQVQKIMKFPHAFLDKVVLPVDARQGRCTDSAKNRKVSARVLGQGWLCPPLCNDRCRMVETVQKNCGVSAVGAGSWTRVC